MGCWDCFCLLCGAPPRNMFTPDYDSSEEYQKMYQKYAKLYAWLYKATILAATGKVYHNMREMSCNIDFSDGKNQFSLYQDKLFDDLGLFVHTDCWKYAKKRLGHPITFNNLPSGKVALGGTGLMDIKYGGIEKYWAQDFDFTKMIKNKNHWMCISPLKNKKNASRINKVLSQLKLTKSEIKKRIKRPSPPLSATFVPKDIKALGNDMDIWVSDGKRWVKIKENIKERGIELMIDRKKEEKLFGLFLEKEQLSMCCVGLLDRGTRKKANKNIIKHPVFIKKMEQLRGKKRTYTLISTEKGYTYLIKKLVKEKIEYKLL